MVIPTKREVDDIIDMYTPPMGRAVLVNSWEFIDHINETFERGGYKELWHTLRFIMGDGTESNVQTVILAEGGEFYPL
jgi:hypothetical protein